MAEAPIQALAEIRLPRVTIQFCTQCKWTLRAAYYAQELLSTFSTSLGEVALQPATGGVFVVEITNAVPATGSFPSHQDNTFASTSTSTDPAPAFAAPSATTAKVVLWDRKTDGGFPETKELKRRVRDVIQPGRDLGHVDRDHQSKRVPEGQGAGAGTGTGTSTGTGTGTGPGTLVAAVMVAGQGRGQGDSGSSGGDGGSSDGAGSKVVGVGEVKEGDDGKREQGGTASSCAVGDGERCEDCE